MTQPRVGVSQQNLDSVVKAVEEIQDLLRARIGLGDPSCPSSCQPITGSPIGSGFANGQPDNLDGAWVRLEDQTSIASALTFTHNLGIEPFDSDSPNVAPLVVSWKHDGTDSSGTPTPLSLEYVTGSNAVTANAIDLRVMGTTRTVDASHPLTILAYFVPVSRW